MTCSLYCLTFPNGKRYIGVARNPRTRLASHKFQKTRLVGGAILEHGDPSLSILATGDKELMYDLEVKMIEEYQTFKPEFGYNVNIGNKHSSISRATISKACRGRTPWNRGKMRTFKDRAAIKAGRDKSERTTGALQKLIARNKAGKGVPRSAESKAKQSAALKGRPKSAEWKAKAAEARRRWWERKRSIEHM